MNTRILGLSLIAALGMAFAVLAAGCSPSEPEPEYEIKKAPEGRVSPTRMKQ